ncbi:hypothetical protein BC939DRAFT_445489 [Gamsiella multidivaricata]|uniref:uncharacterized protein n=1 Tax=Gamsiella multidivaricata TaxID=101098 RepID=UPI00221FD795|nr:uncharacterized protein BC939DRAFT_445489 [Gamsiella multidivaricata]KAG0361149.1 hypothetical protein BGZ54_009210 [Gamsiella multidivaricata]KAG0361152.1 hypothetical protein BGZ54_009213 [Gamsiella multidivaricata]KAI7827524.1 hypothetical protein BC939DRAFT_445489 [Gamsiella multidivaricata]
MDTEHSNKPPPLPSKLRWRPYANGSSKKNSKKREEARLSKTHPQGPNPKATAHKIKGPHQYYTGRINTAPVGIKLQWEEAETIESMSHGGHPHDHHNPQLSRDSSPSADSVFSSSSSKTRSTGNNPTLASDSNSNTSNNPFANAMQRAMASLPSPPPQKLQYTRLDLVGGQSDLTQYRASISGLTTNGIIQNGMPINGLASNNAYQVALNALLLSQSQNAKTNQNFHTSALIATNSSNINTNAPLANTNNAAATAPVAPSPAAASALLGSSNINAFLSDPNRVLSNEELLGVASIDELLSTCGYQGNNSNVIRNQSAQMLASPANTDQSYQASPMNGLVDFNNLGNVSRAASPVAGSFSPMALNSNAFEALLAQPMIPQQPSQQQQQHAMGTPHGLVNNNAPVTNDPYSNLMQDLSSPFGYLSSSTGSTSISMPTAWPSLFPSDDQNGVLNSSTTTVTAVPQYQPKPAPQRSEIATQTDGPYEPPLSPMSAQASSAGSQQSSPFSALGLTSEEQLDPDWLNFLDEASPLFNEVDMPSPPASDNEFMANRFMTDPVPSAKTTQRDRTMWNWAEDLLKPKPMTPTGNRGFPMSTPTMTSIPNGTMGNSGGLIKTLQGTNQTKTKDMGREDARKKAEEDSKKSNKSGHLMDSKESVEIIEPKMEGFGRLIAIMKALWIGGESK